ncbi:hypothetical protein E1B28_012892 [Marasmius oreades]|uniref:Uncharacterized protein n=1 Tax=Marasmius oreades TaxID=181124 RepID=A0A9P7RSQ4_9AGAR|nr:uncharacterized protein E1B28_012892 [Marasmius oreades]KAG7088947.1 hypothetical protein E1B28_012892 [Marasmius oreades]
MSTHTWSFDKNGQTSISHHHCQYLGLLTELKVRYTTTRTYHWPIETYKDVCKWQIARDFEPATINFGCYLEYYLIYNVQPESEAYQAQELNREQPEETSGIPFTENSLLQNDQQQYSPLSTMAAYYAEDAMDVDSPVFSSQTVNFSTASMSDMEVD